MKPINQSAGEALAIELPSMSRRKMLLGMGAASATLAVTVAPDAAGSSGMGDIAITQAENPDLVAAYQKFCDGCAELKEAQQALEWLADEWKHLWPLAPEALLWGANAQDGRYLDDGERDIIGRYLLRDTADLTKRMSAKYRRANPRTCFSILTSARAREVVKDRKKSSPKGRTEKARARNQALRDEAIREYEQKIVLAERYEAETAHLRKVSGADAGRLRVKDADAHLLKMANEVSQCQARTVAGLGMKADAITVTASKLMKIMKSDESPLGQLARLVGSVLQVTREQA
ncbi:hypothetical protein [Rhizobium laguerreae]|uniref:Uncharacterized protein n=1 Tax=Rhizobium laguerreae TaxID=1076926 RepID=A0A7Y2W908_9HYPH|nr:hypothetical protein [Rhizobium laguerreae]NNH67986.1 hypothetical protein [Rhizobium laguerreae]